MLATLNLARKYTPMFSFRKYTFSYPGPPNFADISIFLKISAFFGQNSTFAQSNSVTVMLEIF